ncbi:MAG: transcriptional regulator [Deltaproteobacteria bacterium]|nr:MAG: transcriptional regulator [Deltaproteobacteria bacterium]
MGAQPDGGQKLKLICAIVKTEKIDDLRQKLFEMGAPGITVQNVMGIGKPLGHLRYSESHGFVPKFFAGTRVEIVAEDEQVDEIVDTITSVCRTGEVGDGKVFVWPVERVVRVRTGEKGKDALY